MRSQTLTTSLFLHLCLLFFFFSYSLPANGNDRLKKLEDKIAQDLLKIDIPKKSWLAHPFQEEILDVAIVGGGMSGLCVGFALIKEGLFHFKIFDENRVGKEGTWVNYARMPTLRSGKKLMGPALGVPHLTYWSWYEAKFGKEAWEASGPYAPTPLWHDYLCWFSQVLHLPIENEMKLVNIYPTSNGLQLTFEQEGNKRVIYTRKLVLATGREGAGGLYFPHFLHNLPKSFYTHTQEIIDPSLLRNKKIVIIGGGTSAFDVAAYALENGALSVDMLVRRSSILPINKFGLFSFPGFENGFYELSDELRFSFMKEAFRLGAVSPTKTSLERIKDFNNLFIHYNVNIMSVEVSGSEIKLYSAEKTFEGDFIIAATGFAIDLAMRPELREISGNILLWQDRVDPRLVKEAPTLGAFPYLGKHYELMEDKPNSAPYLKNIYFFNYGALLSHGLMSSAVPGLSLGATRLAKGIAADFFIEESLLYLEKLKEWDSPVFNSEDYPPLKR